MPKSRPENESSEPDLDLDLITDEVELRRLAYKFHGYLTSSNKSAVRRGRQRDRLFIAVQAAAQHLRRWMGADLVSPGDKQAVADTMHVLEDELDAFQRPCGGRLRQPLYKGDTIESLAERTPDEIPKE